MNRVNDMGFIKEKYIANLVVLDANPLVDLDNLLKVNGVIKRGKWYSSVDIRKDINDN
jgi:imidazolonepropionase-like amidohydrolase